MEAKESQKAWEEHITKILSSPIGVREGHNKLLSDFKASLREVIEANIKVLQSNVDNSITPYIKLAWSAHLDENKKFLTLIDTINPKNS